MKLNKILVMCLIFSSFAFNLVAGGSPVTNSESLSDKTTNNKELVVDTESTSKNKRKNLIKGTLAATAALFAAKLSYDLSKKVYDWSAKGISNHSLKVAAGACALAHLSWTFGSKSVNYFKDANVKIFNYIWPAGVK